MQYHIDDTYRISNEFSFHTMFYETSCVFYIPEPLARGYKTHNEFHNTWTNTKWANNKMKLWWLICAISSFRLFAFVFSSFRLFAFVFSSFRFRLFVFSLSSFRLFAFVFSSFRLRLFVFSLSSFRLFAFVFSSFRFRLFVFSSFRFRLFAFRWTCVNSIFPNDISNHVCLSYLYYYLNSCLLKGEYFHKDFTVSIY